jgi:mRNA interferase RelE/StbE
VTGYAVTLADSARKEMRALPSHVIARVQPKLRELTENPRPSGCKKLHGYKHCWRVRVGDYRIIYTIDDTEKRVDVSRIAHRKNVYEP